MELYRPVGEQEFRLIEASGFREFPPRAPEQQLFYPVVERSCAEEIAKRYNPNLPEDDGDFVYVVRFCMDDAFIRPYLSQPATAAAGRELWIPSEDLTVFNQHIVGKIELVSRYGKHRAGYAEEPVFFV